MTGPETLVPVWEVPNDKAFTSDREPYFTSPPVYARIGAMWQTCACSGKLCNFLRSNMGLSWHLHPFKKEERVSRCFDVELHIPPLVLKPPESVFTGIYSIKWGSEPF